MKDYFKITKVGRQGGENLYRIDSYGNSFYLKGEGNGEFETEEEIMNWKVRELLDSFKRDSIEYAIEAIKTMQFEGRIISMLDFKKKDGYVYHTKREGKDEYFSHELSVSFDVGNKLSYNIIPPKGNPHIDNLIKNNNPHSLGIYKRD